MTHQYTLLVGGTVLPSLNAPPASAIAWAEDIVLAIGSDEEVRGISRGDSMVIDLHGTFVVPMGGAGAGVWPPSASLEVGGPADFAILAEDPRSADRAVTPIGLVRGGRLLSGSLGPSKGPRSTSP